MPHLSIPIKNRWHFLTCTALTLSVLGFSNLTQSAPMSVQSVGVNHQIKTLNFPDNGMVPVVIAGVPSYVGADPGVISLHSITQNGVSLSFKEWDYRDGRHALEQVSIFSLQPGRYNMPDGSVWEVGRFNLSGTRIWQAQAFTRAFAGTPKLFLSAQTSNGLETFTARARQVSNTGFEAALFEQESLNDGHVMESIGYLAIDNAVDNGSVNLQGINQPYQLQTFQLNQNFQSVGQHSLKIEEERSKDSEIVHTLETVAVLDINGHVFAQDISSIGRDTAVLRRGLDTVPVPAEVNLNIEAEDYTRLNDVGTTTDSFSLNTRTDASGGKYMQSVGQNGQSWLEYDFVLPEDGVYEISIRGTGVSSGTNSVFISVDGGADSVVHLNVDDSWGWKTVKDNNSGLGPYILSANKKHTLRLRKRESNTKIDQLLVSNTAGVSLPIVSVSPNSLSFGNQDVGSVSNPQSITLSNTGIASSTLFSISTVGDFSETNDCGNVLPAGGSCQITVRFSPAGAGSKNGTLLIESENSNSPTQVSLSGAGNTQAVEFYQNLNDIAAGTVLSEAQIRSSFGPISSGVANRALPEGVKVVPDPGNSGRGNSLQVFFPKGEFGNKKSGAAWQTKLPARNEYYFAFDIYVPIGFNFPLSWKMPGLFGGNLLEASGLTTPDGVAGFAVRQGISSEPKNGKAPGFVGIGDGNIVANTYTYNKGTKLRIYNPALNRSRNGASKLTLGQWVKIEQHVVLNDATNVTGAGVKSNGIYEAWVDGVKVYSQNNWIYRRNTSLKIDHITFIWYYGGKDAAFTALEDQYSYYDNFIVSTQPITH